MQSNRKRQVSDKPASMPRAYAPSWPLHMLPSGVDWRGTGADSVLKDQAMCGSCWSFAAVAPMEAAYFRHYGASPVARAFYVFLRAEGPGDVRLVLVVRADRSGVTPPLRCAP
jgi:Papain family cysteine protease